MHAEIDFPKGTPGKYFRPGARLDLPVQLEAEVQAFPDAHAAARGVGISHLVNELLKNDIELMQSVG